MEALSNKLEIPKTTVFNYVTKNLGMRKILSKWVPHELTIANMEHRILSCEKNLSMLSKDKTLLKRTLTLDETWVSLYMSPNKDQAKIWAIGDEVPEKIVRDQRFGIKRMLIMAMDFDGICFYELLPEKTTVNALGYKNFLNRIIPEWLQGKNFRRPILLHDNS